MLKTAKYQARLSWLYKKNKAYKARGGCVRILSELPVVLSRLKVNSQINDPWAWALVLA